MGGGGGGGWGVELVCVRSSISLSVRTHNSQLNVRIGLTMDQYITQQVIILSPFLQILAPATAFNVRLAFRISPHA